GVELRQSYTRVGKFALIQHQRYAHAKQFKRANRALRTLKTYLGRVIRDITRKIDGDHGLEGRFAHLLSLSRRVREQQRGQRGHNAPADYKFKIYTSKQKRRVTPALKREMRRRSAVEPVIGHLKDEHRMGRNYLAHRNGDLNNAILAAVGYNFRRLIKWLRILLRLILMALFSKSKLSPA